jgi:superoxide dismutase, Cu-Zn family
MAHFGRLAAAVAAIGIIGATPGAASQTLIGIAAASAQTQAYSPDAAAVTYNEAMVPSGAKIFTLNLQGTQGTSMVLAVRGLPPSRQFGGHIHTKPCGADPADAGGHYQNNPDPKQPSTDPAYANNRNEIWLDFATDAQGSALTTASVDWQPKDSGQSRSFVIHEHHTHNDGSAGARLACMNVAF